MIDEHAIRSLVEGDRLGIPRDMCYRPAPGTNRTVVCARPRGHGITNMTLPDGRCAYIDHNSRQDGTGEGWG